MSQRGQLVSGSQPPVQLLSGASANFNEDYTQDYDYEASVLGGAGDATLSSVEASFDRLWQSVSYRDRAQFAAYVRAEVDRDSSSSSSTSTLSTSRSSNGVHLLSGDHFPSFSYLHKAFAAYGRLPVWWRSVLDRFYLLAGLLFLQSCSSLILSHFADFIQKHVIVTLYLTMLVGAGGNAGNQSAVLVIRLLATSSKRIQSMQILLGEVKVAAVLGVLMLLVGFCRVYLFEGGNWLYACAITASLYVIVTVSIVVGAGLPLLLQRLKFDPAHAGPIIQVLMDVSGVLCTCAICSLFLGDADGPMSNTALAAPI